MWENDSTWNQPHRWLSNENRKYYSAGDGPSYRSVSFRPLEWSIRSLLIVVFSRFNIIGDWILFPTCGSHFPSTHNSHLLWVVASVAEILMHSLWKPPIRTIRYANVHCKYRPINNHKGKQNRNVWFIHNTLTHCLDNLRPRMLVATIARPNQ